MLPLGKAALGEATFEILNEEPFMVLEKRSDGSMSMDVDWKSYLRYESSRPVKKGKKGKATR